ncbi:hypothetical protein SKAU_G00292890 [Synaphobranchus kaupii]|uniref:Uncharacterized protein n=1 Tax=Synaphobranchus kaupii TaxID=118154 RepID=A0A9Q1EU44_SYNKA|nr:hypothetical protein SKAU_G00292890 [Synaphobranchus kaupii]
MRFGVHCAAALAVSAAQNDTGCPHAAPGLLEPLIRLRFPQPEPLEGGVGNYSSENYPSLRRVSHNTGCTRVQRGKETSELTDRGSRQGCRSALLRIGGPGSQDRS